MTLTFNSDVSHFTASKLFDMSNSFNISQYNLCICVCICVSQAIDNRDKKVGVILHAAQWLRGLNKLMVSNLNARGLGLHKMFVEWM